MRGGFDSIHAFAELCDVEIRLEDALFRPHRLDEHGEVGFQGFADEATIPKEQVFRDLLGDRAGAAKLLAVLAGTYGFADGLEVEAGVKRKLLVLGGDDRYRGV